MPYFGFDETVWDAILAKLAGGESLVSICEADGVPRTQLVYQRAREDAAWLERYKQARLDQADALAEMALREAMRAGDAQLGRLAYDARKWFAGRMHPKKYGDKQITEHSGPDGGPVPVQTVIVTGVRRATDKD